MTTNARDLFELKGKVAIVTGASKGIGEAIARGLATFGARVVLSGRRQETVEAAANSIGETGGIAVAVAAHMGDPSAIRNLVERTCTTFGGIDIVVNNAATNPVYGPLLKTDDAMFEKIMAINVRGPMELAKHAHPHMATRGGGSIINISSVGGVRPEPMLGLYSVSKAALISLTKVMAQEWGRDGIRVNAICPGLVRTKFSAALWQDEAVCKEFTRTLPLGRIAEPEEMIGLALFLASPASSYCTGGVYLADGGHTL